MNKHYDRTMCKRTDTFNVLKRRPDYLEPFTHNDNELPPALKKFIQEENAIFLDSLRVPTRMAYLLRESICSQEERLQHPMHIQLENKLLSSVDSIVQGYYGYVYCKCHFSLHLI